MELELKKGMFRAAMPVFSRTATAEESADAVVPDSKPDILRIVETTAVAELSGKEIRGEKIYLSGVVRCFALYAPEGGSGVESLPVVLPFSAACEPGTELPKSMVIRAEIESVSAVSREQNPRRINVRATVRLTCRGWSMGENSWCEDVPGAEEYGVELLSEDMVTMCVAGFGEKLLNVTESAELGEVKVAGAELLRWDVRPRVTETKLIPEKIVFKGEIDVRALLKTPEDSVSATHITLTVPFSGVTDCDGADTDAEAILNCRCFDTELTLCEETGTGRGMVTLKTNVAVEAEARRAQEITVVTDAYSTTHDLKTVFGRLTLIPEQKRTPLRISSKENLSAGIGIRSVFCVDIVPEEMSLAEGEISFVFRASAVFEGEDGGIYSVSKSFRTASSAPDGAEGAVSGIRIFDEGYRISGADEIEIRASAEAFAESGEELVTNVLSGAAATERECSGRTPSLTLCGTLEGETWWDLGKRMRARVEEILSANGLSEGDPPGDRMLLIPKKAPCRSGKMSDGGKDR